VEQASTVSALVSAVRQKGDIAYRMSTRHEHSQQRCNVDINCKNDQSVAVGNFS
jgi:hypothetical protein